jgi:hypothetical protein
VKEEKLNCQVGMQRTVERAKGIRVTVGWWWVERM